MSMVCCVAIVLVHAPAHSARNSMKLGLLLSGPSWCRPAEGRQMRWRRLTALSSHCQAGDPGGQLLRPWRMRSQLFASLIRVWGWQRQHIRANIFRVQAAESTRKNQARPTCQTWLAYAPHCTGVSLAAVIASAEISQSGLHIHLCCAVCRPQSEDHRVEARGIQEPARRWPGAAAQHG